MNNSRFVILTGHLNDYPLSDLVGILRHQRKTGRLLIEYEKGPGIFFFHEGELVDAKLNDLTGLQAVCFAVAQPPASFNFNPLIQATQKTIEDSLQRTVSELFGCWDESNVEIEVAAIDIPLLQETVSEPVVQTLPQSLPYEAERLSLPPAAVSSSRRPASLLLMTTAAVATLGVSTAIALSGSFRSDNPDKHASPAAIERSTGSDAAIEPGASAQRSPVAKNVEGAARSRARSERSSQSDRADRAQERKDDSAARSESEPLKSTSDAEATPKSQQSESVTVVMEIENGRVLRASIANPKPGLDSYEALALRIARQRRYSAQQSGRETVKIKVSPSDQ